MKLKVIKIIQLFQINTSVIGQVNKENIKLSSNLSCTKLPSVNITDENNEEIYNDLLKEEPYDDHMNNDVFFDDIDIIKEELNNDDVSLASSDDEPLSLHQKKKRGRKKKINVNIENECNDAHKVS